MSVPSLQLPQQLCQGVLPNPRPCAVHCHERGLLVLQSAAGVSLQLQARGLLLLAGGKWGLSCPDGTSDMCRAVTEMA